MCRLDAVHFPNWGASLYQKPSSSHRGARLAAFSCLCIALSSDSIVSTCCSTPARCAAVGAVYCTCTWAGRKRMITCRRFIAVGSADDQLGVQL